jgi:hypothetical protein
VVKYLQEKYIQHIAISFGDLFINEEDSQEDQYQKLAFYFKEVTKADMKQSVKSPIVIVTDETQKIFGIEVLITLVLIQILRDFGLFLNWI